MKIAQIKREIEKEIGYVFPENTLFLEVAEGLRVSKKQGELTVCYAHARDVMRAGLIAKANDGIEEYAIEEKSQFKDVCLMIDCSRNAVRNVETVKKLVRNIALLGYNALMLYTEDTYEVDGEPIFGYLRGRYTKEELKELDAFALSLGIELIPCVQTLAHLNQIKRYSVTEYNYFDCMDILEIGNPKTYELIENIFKTVCECFTSRRIHVGMDEAWMVGRGRYLEKNGHRKAFDVFCEHLTQVCDLAEKYGLKPIIWSDIFCNALCAEMKAKNGKGADLNLLMKRVPKNLELCCWEYHGLTPEHFDGKLSLHEKFQNPVWFAGGTLQDNRGFLPHLSYSLRICQAAITAAKKHNMDKLLATAWGDNGGECAIFSSLPTLANYAYVAKGISKTRLKKEFYALTGYSFDSFMKLEYGQTFNGKYVKDIGNPAKYGLYSDPFSGYLDVTIAAEDEREFERARLSVSRLRKGQYGYLFESAYRLNDVLALKYGLGVRLRKAYAEGDREELSRLAERMKKIIAKLTAFIAVYRKQWKKENKPNGLEIQEIRLGGLKERLIGCRETLLAYLDGREDRIPELEEKLLPQAVGRKVAENRCDEFSYMAIASVNSFDGFADIDV